LAITIRFRKRQLTSRAKSQKASVEPSRTVAIARGCSAQTEVKKLQPSQAASILAETAAAEERNEPRKARTDSINRAEQGKNQGQVLRQSATEISELPRKRTKTIQISHPSNGSRNELSPSIPLPHTIRPRPSDRAQPHTH